ncbi:MAG: hypothetical protein BWY44_01053 [Candidatus Omnitrophica bacterium ADurb.Bin292]|nr:MAG: hypothetical protein BWY44_01053 [Candidatus Omnitrophica bacterium ADurb.Bin292]
MRMTGKDGALEFKQSAILDLYPRGIYGHE